MSFADFFLILFFAKVCPSKKLSLKSFGKKNSLPFSIKKGVLTSLSIDIQQSVAMSGYCKTFFCKLLYEKVEKKNCFLIQKSWVKWAVFMALSSLDDQYNKFFLHQRRLVFQKGDVMVLSVNFWQHNNKNVPEIKEYNHLSNTNWK